MSAPDAAVLDAIEALAAADVGAGGLGNTASSAYVPFWYRDGETAMKSNGVPAVVARASVAEEANFGDLKRATVRVRLTVVTVRETDHTQSDAIVSRLRELLDGAALSPSGWGTAGPSVVGVAQVEQTDSRIYRAVDLVLWACES